MAEYLVRWEINVSADSHREAAKQARQAQIRPGTTATVFEVSRRPATIGGRRGAWVTVDLDETAP
jgi:hypothetical protein